MDAAILGKPADVCGLIFKRRGIAGSLIGGIAEPLEMLDFCAAHNIVSDSGMTLCSRSTRPTNAC